MKNVFNERKNLKRFLLKVDFVCCDLRELDLKILSSNSTIYCDTWCERFLLTPEDES